MFCRVCAPVAGPSLTKGEYPPGGLFTKDSENKLQKYLKRKNYFYLFNNDSHFICRSQALPHPPAPASMYLEDVSAFQTRHEKFSEQLRRRKSTDHLYFLYRYAVALRYIPYRLEPAQIIFTVNLNVIWPGRNVILPLTYHNLVRMYRFNL